jgi:hypothetical protein
MTGTAYCLRTDLLVLLVTLTSFSGQFGCSGEPSSPAVTNGGSTSASGGSATGGHGIVGSSGGAGAGVGGQLSTGGATHVGGSSSAGAGGVCGSGCTATSAIPSVTCGTLPVYLSCMGPFPSNLSTIMSANGCTNVPINSVAYCCPAAILTTCR